MIRSSQALPAFLALAVAACGGQSATPATTPAPATGEVILDARTGAPVTRDALVKRLKGADYVLLGEVHDNAVAAPAACASSSTPAPRRSRPSCTSSSPGARTACCRRTPTQPIEEWLDRAGFDRKGWRWPLHQPLLDVAVKDGLPRYGSQLNRDKLRTVMRSGAASAPAPLGDYMTKVPLTEAGGKALEATLSEGHCGELPAEMVPMMRNAQEARDAAMTDAMFRAARGRAAGVAHRRQRARAARLRGAAHSSAQLAPTKRAVVVGFLEREPDGALPSEAERQVYDVVWVTERAEREDPCKAMRGQ